MKLLLFFVLLNIVCYAAEDCNLAVSPLAENLANSFQPTNCLDLKKIKKTKLANAFNKANDREDVCSDCRSKLGKIRIPSSKYKEEFRKAVFDELRKSLSQTMFELMSLRSGRELSFDPTGAESSCKISKIITEEDGVCFKENFKLIEEIKNQLATEFANTVDKKFDPSGLLERTTIEGCLVTDKEAIFSHNRYTETFLPSIVKALTGMGEFKSNKTILEQLNEYIAANNLSIDLGDFLSHPLISNILSSKENAIKFLTKVKGSGDVEFIRSYLYSKENSSTWASALEKKCKDQFGIIKQTLCGGEFKNDNFAIDSKPSIEAVKGIEINLSQTDRNEKVQAMIQYCQDMDAKNEKTISFKNLKVILNEDLSPSNQDFPYKEYKSEAYKSTSGSIKETLCEISKDPSKCLDKTASCSIFKLYEDSKKPGSSSNNILAAHDKNIDRILRALIGEPLGISEHTRSVLIAEGIFKNPQGTFNIQDTPERKTEFYNTEVVKADLAQTASVTNSLATSVKTTKTVTQNYPSAPPVSYPTNSTASSDNQPLPFSSSPSPDEEIRNNLQKQILDRLGKQVTSKQIEDMVAKAYNKGRANPMTQQQVEEKTREVLEDMPTNSIGGGSSFNNNQGTAKVSVDKDREKKARQLGFLKAKYGIDPNAPAGSKGAQGKAGSNGDENLKVVAVTNAAELKIVVGDFKNLKNAQIAELMKKQTPFILQIGKVAYKIAFQNGQLEIIPPKGVQRDPATISNLQNYILNLAKAQPDRSLYNELMKVNFKG